MSTDQKQEPKVQTDADLISANAMLRAEVEARKNQIRQASDLFNRISAEKDAAVLAEKNRVVDSIMEDVPKANRDDYAAKDLKTLQDINTALKMMSNRAFASVAASDAEQERRSKPQLTAGKWDGKTWIGGL